MRTSSTPSPSRSKGNDDGTGDQAVLSLGYPLVFHWLVMAAALILLLYSAVQHIVPILAISTFYLVFALVCRLWSRQALRHVVCQLTLNRNRAFTGEKVELELRVTNAKRLFLPWLDIQIELPYRLVTSDLKTHSPYSRERLRWTTSISGGQSIKWSHNLECRARGDYRLGPVRISSGDILGFFPKETLIPHFESLLIYPRIVPLDELHLPLNELTGETVASRNLYADVSRTIGTRDYHYDDPFNRIHWKASARQTQLQVRQYESTTSLNLFLILDVSSFGQETEVNKESFELALTTVASIANELCRQQFSFGLLANTLHEVEIPVSNGRQQLMLLLEVLAKMQMEPGMPFTRHLDEHLGNLPFGTTLLVVTHDLSSGLLSTAQRLRRDGHSVLVVCIGVPAPPSQLNDIPIIAVRSMADCSLIARGSVHE